MLCFRPMAALRQQLTFAERITFGADGTLVLLGGLSPSREPIYLNPYVYRSTTSEGNVVTFGGKWYLYTPDGMFIRGFSKQETVALNEELMLRSLPRGEDR
jgi:hypothetical protein